MFEKKILVLNANEEERNELIGKLEGNGSFKVCANFDNAQGALEFLKSNKVDLVISDIILQNSDGFEFLEGIRKNDLDVKVLILSAITKDTFVQKALQLGASYYIMRPYSEDVLIQRIDEIINNNNIKVKEDTKISEISRSKNIDSKLSNIFISVGIPAHIKGYQFLREAIKMAIETPDIINSITKKLYPSIAKKFDTSSSKVERAIRHAIEVAWNRGKIENINNLFGIKVYSDNEKPTNGEFIALVADKMLIEGA